MNRIEQKRSPVNKVKTIITKKLFAHLNASAGKLGKSFKETAKTFKQKTAQTNKSKIATLLSKNYIVHLGVIILAVVLAGFNVYAQGNTQTVSRDSSILFGLLGKNQDNIEIVTAESIRQAADENSLIMASVLSASATTTGTGQTIGLNAKEDQDVAKQSNEIASVGGEMLMKNNPTTTNVSEKPRTEIIKYTVEPGDNVTNIASKFGIDVSTILIENELYADSIVKTGDQLTILPTSGKTERVDEGETLDQIASKHEVDTKDIIAFNKLSGASDVQVADILVIPDAKREIPTRPEPEPEPERAIAYARDDASHSNDSAASYSYSDTGKTVSSGSNTNAFPYGWCTWYVASKKNVTWMGNAGEWLGNAASQGYATGRVPAVGSIMVTSESWWGHVAYVEAVNGNMVTVSEMNYAGWGVVSTRTIDVTRFGSLKGFIY